MAKDHSTGTKLKRGNIMKTYIQLKSDHYLETVDEFKTRKEAREMLAEYRLADSTGHYYLSQRACKDWTE